jgi:hypothetical protein
MVTQRRGGKMKKIILLCIVLSCFFGCGLLGIPTGNIYAKWNGQGFSEAITFYATGQFRLTGSNSIDGIYDISGTFTRDAEYIYLYDDYGNEIDKLLYELKSDSLIIYKSGLSLIYERSEPTRPAP